MISPQGCNFQTGGLAYNTELTLMLEGGIVICYT